MSDTYTGQKNFEHDLVVANNTEREIALYLPSLGIEVLEFNNDGQYDLLCRDQSNTEFTIEIKEDFSCAKYGNVALEYESRGKASGIAASNADMFVYKIHRKNGSYGLYMATTEQLRNMVSSNLWHRKVDGGDPGSQTLMYLFREDVFCGGCLHFGESAN